MRISACALLFLVSAGAYGAEAAQAEQNLSSLREAISRHIAQPRFASASWGIKIVSLDGGPTVFEHHAHKLMKPASNAKLFSGALALDRFGPDYRIKTSLHSSSRPTPTGTLKGDLIVYGRGDPSFAARFNQGDHAHSLEPLATALASAGVKRIKGDLIGDERFFRGPNQGSGWTWDDLQHYYGAEASALSVNDNVVDLVFKPGARLGIPCLIHTQPETSFLQFINRSTTTSAPPRTIDLHRPIGQNAVYVSGQLPLDDPGLTNSVAVHDPARWFVALFKETLARRGIKVLGRLRAVDWLERETPPIDFAGRIELGFSESPPLREILARMMKSSQNLYAQLLLLHVAARHQVALSDQSSGPANTQISAGAEPESRRTTEEMGVAELKIFLSEAGIGDDEVLLEEGSGLSRAALLTPNATVGLLVFMSRHRHAGVFRETLPIAGQDGTLRNRMRGTLAAGNVRAKTGSLRYVNTLSGYVTTAGGESWAFSIMLNNYSNCAPTNDPRADLDEIAVLLADFKGHTAPTSQP